MRRNFLIKTATNIACEYLETEGILVTTEVMRTTVEKWENLIPYIDDPLTLAAVAMENPSTKILFSRTELRILKNFYFPYEFFNKGRGV